MADEDPYIPDQGYTFDGTNYRPGQPMPREVAREHGLVDDDEEDTGGEPSGTLIPDDFPYSDQFRDAGYDTLEAVDEASDETIIDEVDLVGPGRIDDVRAALDEALGS